MPTQSTRPSTEPRSGAASVQPVPPRKKGKLPEYRAAEFFAGIGLVRQALEAAGIQVAWANDIEPVKAALYAANFPSDHYVVGDVRDERGTTLPDVDIATASFPCTDLSLAGARRGLAGAQSGMFWEFARILDEMGDRRPSIVMLENVPGFASSHGGRDLLDAIRELNRLGYSCDILQVDARVFAPQSRLRLFIVGSKDPLGSRPIAVDDVRPDYVIRFASQYPELRLHAWPLRLPRPDGRTLADVVERLEPDAPEWWDRGRSTRFMSSLSPLQQTRLQMLAESGQPTWRTAYRRTRAGVAVWEIRADEIAGCLRTARGGSSKQAVVEVDRGAVRVRWMTAREYARLQGASDEFNLADLSDNQVMFGFGDAVCVPVVQWLATSYLLPALDILHGRAALSA